MCNADFKAFFHHVSQGSGGGGRSKSNGRPDTIKRLCSVPCAGKHSRNVFAMRVQTAKAQSLFCESDISLLHQPVRVSTKH